MLCNIYYLINLNVMPIYVLFGQKYFKNFPNEIDQNCKSVQLIQLSSSDVRIQYNNLFIFFEVRYACIGTTGIRT